MLIQMLEVAGGVSVVVVALAGFLGKMFFEREKKEMQASLEIIKGDIQSNNKEIQASLDKGLHVHKVQFENEYSIYQQAWNCLVEMRQNTLRLRPMLDRYDPNEDKNERIQKRLGNFGRAAEAYRDVIEKNKPFYAAEVYRCLFDVLDKCHTESIEYEQGDEPDPREYWEGQRKNHSEINKAIEQACESIRNRIWAISVI